MEEGWRVLLVRAITPISFAFGLFGHHLEELWTTRFFIFELSALKILHHRVLRQILIVCFITPTPCQIY